MNANTRAKFTAPQRALALLLSALALGGLLALGGCGHKADTRDPVAVTRAFLLAWWHGDQDAVRELTCPDTQWPEIGKPDTSIDLDHARLEATFSGDNYAEVTLGGVVTFKTGDGLVEVRDYDRVGTVIFVLRRIDGWKVCDTLSAP